MAHLNIEHYKRLLATETNDTRRKVLQKLLAEEEAKLALIEQKSSAPGGIRSGGRPE